MSYHSNKEYNTQTF